MKFILQKYYLVTELPIAHLIIPKIGTSGGSSKQMKKNVRCINTFPHVYKYTPTPKHPHKHIHIQC